MSRPRKPLFFKAPAAPRKVAPRELELHIERLSDEGRGMGFAGGKPVFVAGGLPGEQVRAQLYTDKRELAEARLLTVLEPSAQRVAAPCELFGRCGGCQLQMLDYPAQLAHKQAVLEKLLAPFAVREWAPPLTAEPWHYRHRARLSVTEADGKPRVGFKAAHSHAVVAVGACPVLDQRLQPVLAALPEWLSRLAQWRRLRELVIAVAADGRIGLDWLAEPRLPEADAQSLRQAAAAAGVVVGEPLRYAVPSQGYDFAFQPGDFTQVNPAVNDLMVARVLDWLAPTAADTVADCFAGLGNFTLALAQRAGRVIGFEVVAPMVERARANAAALGLTHVEFETLDLFAESAALPPGFDKVLLDPPRAGAAQLCRSLARRPPAALLYVSCNPHTLARDLSMLTQAGLSVERAALVDLFPHTGHSEAMVLLTRR